MPTFTDSFDSLPELVATLATYAEAGIDPAFDSDLDELEREFAEYRLTRDHF